MSSQTHKTSVHLRNTYEDIFDNFLEFSDPLIDINVITTIKVQKHSKDIVKIIQVKSSWALLSFRYMCGHTVGGGQPLMSNGLY